MQKIIQNQIKKYRKLKNNIITIFKKVEFLSDFRLYLIKLLGKILRNHKFFNILQKD